jgi:hypothetical protein
MAGGGHVTPTDAPVSPPTPAPAEPTPEPAAAEVTPDVTEEAPGPVESTPAETAGADEVQLAQQDDEDSETKPDAPAGPPSA